MVLLWLPYTFCIPGTRTFYNADRRRLHGINRNASSAPLGQAVLEARPRQRRGLYVSGPHTRSGGHWPDSLSNTESQGHWYDAVIDRLRRPGHDRLLSPHAGPQDAEDQPLHRAIPDFLGSIQRLRPSRELGRLSSLAPLRNGHARGHLQSQARRLLVGASSLAVSNTSRRQEALGA